MSIPVVLVVGVGSRHVWRQWVGGPGWSTSQTMAIAMAMAMPRTEEMMAAARAGMGREGRILLSFDLGSRGGQEIDIHAGGRPVPVSKQHLGCVSVVGMGRGDVGRGDLGDRGRSGDGLGHGRGHHHRSGRVDERPRTTVRARDRGHRLRLVSPPRVGIIVNPRVARQLIRATETLGAARELARMGLFAGMGPNVAGLMLEAVKGPVAQRALVGSREIWSNLFRRWPRTLHERWQQAD